MIDGGKMTKQDVDEISQMFDSMGFDINQFANMDREQLRKLDPSMVEFVDMMKKLARMKKN